MADYAIIVEFKLKPNTRSLFRRLVDANAMATLGTEPGCRRFDVLEPEGEDDRVVLYEIYRDRSAFEHHLGTPHFAAFDAAVAGMIAHKSVSEYELVCEATRAGHDDPKKPARLIADQTTVREEKR
jgi:quinol monooxygenase YgiN